jgi:predicted AlkP superfamily pyrophosphatase or phosphodiesterase
LVGCTGGLGARASSRAVSDAVVLIALDGFRPDYLDRPASRHLRELAREGIRARWLVPVFPTVTFPNFYTIATGLYPEHHGIVSNTMRDSRLGRFTLRDTAAVHDPRWWDGEPIWVTAVRQGKRAATFFWPGSDVAIGGVRPTYYKVFNPRVPDADRVRQVLEWLSLPPDSAPTLVTLYLGDVDEAGHEFGPDAPETDSAIARVDSAVGAIMTGVGKRGMDRQVNLVVVSDHGMTELKSGQLIYLDDYIDTRSADVVELGPIVSLTPHAGAGEEVYRQLSQAPHLKVYRKSDIPVAYHYRTHSRIPAIIGIADEGWVVTTHADLAARGGRLLRGMHGYPPDVPSMRATFLARGPAFGKGVVVEPFQNIHIYSLLANIMQLRPAPTDGALDSVKAVLSR